MGFSSSKYTISSNWKERVLYQNGFVTKIKRLKIGNKISCSIKGYAIYKRILKFEIVFPMPHDPGDVIRN
jgi:hypothetical protein